jgi:hypothetical protein
MGKGVESVLGVLSVTKTGRRLLTWYVGLEVPKSVGKVLVLVYRELILPSVPVDWRYRRPFPRGGLSLSPQGHSWCHPVSVCR